MKTYPLISFLAAAVAFAFSPLSFDLAVSLLFALGLGCVVLHDYVREAPRLRTRRASLGSVSHQHRPETCAFELAA